MEPLKNLRRLPAVHACQMVGAADRKKNVSAADGRRMAGRLKIGQAANNPVEKNPATAS
jgi:hypothetical protein